MILATERDWPGSASAGLVEFDAAFMQEARQGVQRESA
jgi:hypothetical protein